MCTGTRFASANVISLTFNKASTGPLTSRTHHYKDKTLIHKQTGSAHTQPVNHGSIGGQQSQTLLLLSTALLIELLGDEEGGDEMGARAAKREEGDKTKGIILKKRLNIKKYKELNL